MDESGELPKRINSSALNEWVFNEDTIWEVLNILMTNGLRIDYGENLGKTIIFAKNHRHAEKILEIFGREYPNLPWLSITICVLQESPFTDQGSVVEVFTDRSLWIGIKAAIDRINANAICAL